MHDALSVSLNGKQLMVPQGTTVAAALTIAGHTSFRRSVSGEPRGPLCGMGICFECRTEIDGVAHKRSCQIVCTPGMNIKTDG